MRFVLRGPGWERELTVALDAPDVTLAEVLAAADVEVPDAVMVGGRVVPTDHSVAESAIPDGAVVRLGRHPGGATVALRDDPRDVGLRLSVVAGASSGASVALRGSVVVGRAATCGLVLGSTTVSDEHCRVTVDPHGGVSVSDLGSTNGTWVDGQAVPASGGVVVAIGAVIRCGAVVLRVEEVMADDRPRTIDPLRHLGAARAVPFNRPPRPAAPAPVPAVVVVEPAPRPQERPVFSVAALVAPLVMAGAMVVVMGSIRFALFALLSPLMLLANTFSGRRRAATLERADAEAHRTDLARFATEVRAAGRAETERRWQLCPSPAEVVRRALAPSTRLWERRATHDDQLLLAAGVGPVPWTPRLRTADGREASPDVSATPAVKEVLAAHGRLPDAPVAVDLSRGGVVGIVGDREVAAGLARSLLLQACVHHGPADLPVAVVVDEHRLGDWSWTTWLPHVRHTDGAGDGARLAVAGAQGELLLRGLLADAVAEGEQTVGLAAYARGGPTSSHRGHAGARAASDARPEAPTLLVVMDAPGHLRGRDAAARAVLRGEAGPVAGIVIAATEDQLPAVCDTVVRVASSDAEATLVRPSERLVVEGMLVAAVGASTARRVARRLAGFEDPEVDGDAARLPTRVDLLDLLGRDAVTARGISARWAASAGSPRLTAPIGVGADGPLELDLVVDGPHGLLGGTTGSGKSELLRSLVAGLAARHDPDHLTFVLVDYKGGAAFDVCRELPHVVGLVTDLDEHLGERALRCLEAELDHRERRLRGCGVSDLPGWLRLSPDQRGAPLPRLLVVVDEFATLKAELPDFVSALVGIAQRGRSLGVHLLLGTQRPSGAVDENVRANSNLRIALRVTDTQDSSDVVGVPDAAHIAPSLPGRGVAKVGPGAVLPLQTALVTGRSGGAGPRVRVGPVRFGPRTTLPPVAPAADEGPSDLDALVRACVAASEDGRFGPPRRPWPEPLPAEVDLAALVGVPADEEVGPGVLAGSGVLAMAVEDVPDEQAQRVTGWDLDAGNLLVHGVVGSGTTTTALSCVLAAASRLGPDALHVQVLDLGRGGLSVLDGLPHVGAVVLGREEERRARLLQHWTTEADRRRAMDRETLEASPRLLLVIDGLESLMAELDDPATYEVGDALLRVLADAPALRISAVLTTTRAGGLRSALTSTIEQRWTHRLADRADYALLGLRPAEVPTLRPGRALRLSDGRELHVARPHDPAGMVAALAARWGQPAVAPVAIRTLPTAVRPAELADRIRIGSGAWELPLGRGARDLEPAVVRLHAGEHGLLLGGPGSGRSGVLGALAKVAAGVAGLDVIVCGGSTASPLLGDGHRVVAPDGLGAALRAAAIGTVPTLVVVDDADRVPDPGPALEALAQDGTRVHLVAAARATTVQADFGHWLRRLARARVGAFLRPQGDVPGDLLGARPPRRTPAPVTPGRGWLISGGDVEFVQLAVHER